jgi:hypothetical protein
MTDWRLHGQERYLRQAELCYRTYEIYRKGWDHDHCEFCQGKFAIQGGDFTEGYATADHYRWICKNCYMDFKDIFDWKIIPSDDRPASPVIRAQ